MSELKGKTRLSFSVNKVAANEYKVGSSGITATSESASNPYSPPVYDEQDGYTSSELLYQNIDKLGERFKNNKSDEPIISQAEEEEIEEENDISGLSEDEVIRNLDYHLGLRGNKTIISTLVEKSNTPDNFCRSCGEKYITSDNFCGKCGNKRT